MGTDRRFDQARPMADGACLFVSQAMARRPGAARPVVTEAPAGLHNTNWIMACGFCRLAAAKTTYHNPYYVNLRGEVGLAAPGRL